MEMTGEQLIPASQETVWEALNDPAILKACIPGCESIEKLADDMYRISVLAAVGPIRARFNGQLTLGDIDPPRGYTLGFEVSGGAAGFGKGGAAVALQPAAGGTQLSYTAKAEVSGKLAQVGSRLIDGIAKKMAAEFFARFCASFNTPAEDVGKAASAVPDAMPGAVAGGSASSQVSGAVPTDLSALNRELRAWRTVAITAIAVACLAIGYIAGSL